MRRLQETLNFVGTWGADAFPRGRGVADFLKVTSVLGGRVEQVDHRMLRAVPESVFRFAGNLDEVSRACFKPRHLSAVFDKYFNIARKNEENFDGLVTVDGY